MRTRTTDCGNDCQSVNTVISGLESKVTLTSSTKKVGNMRCNKCSREAPIGQSRCNICLAGDRRYISNRRQFRKDNHLCLRCGSSQLVTTCYCQVCLDKYKAWRDKDRRDTICHYGGVCQCCGEDRLNFLTIDHINGGGTQHRQKLKTTAGNSFYRWLRKQGYPEGYRVLCFNCNCAIGLHGQCPHQEALPIRIGQLLLPVSPA